MTELLFLNCLLHLDVEQKCFGRLCVLIFGLEILVTIPFHSLVLLKLKLLIKAICAHCHIFKQYSIYTEKNGHLNPPSSPTLNITTAEFIVDPSRPFLCLCVRSSYPPSPVYLHGFSEQYHKPTFWHTSVHF